MASGREEGRHRVPGDDWTGRCLHFVGIGGAGMSGLALIAHALGATVTGSDRSESAYTVRLREQGIEPVIGHDAGNVPDGCRGGVLDRGAGEQPRAPGRPAPASCTGPTCWPRSHRCAAAWPSPGRTARRRRRRWSCTPCAAAGSTRATWSAASCAPRAQRRLGDGRLDRDRGRRIGPIAAQARSRDRRPHQRRARSPLDLCARSSISRTRSARSWRGPASGPWSGIVPRLRALCPAGRGSLRRRRSRA